MTGLPVRVLGAVAVDPVVRVPALVDLVDRVDRVDRAGPVVLAVLVAAVVPADHLRASQVV